MKSKSLSKTAVMVILAAFFFTMAGCDFNSLFVRVALIEGVPETGTVGTPVTLTGTVKPVFANNKNIVWSVKNAGTTGADISGNILNANAEGTVTITARIANGMAEGKEYTQDFFIVFKYGVPVIKPITSVALNVTGPAKNSAPDTMAVPADVSAHYTAGAVSWSPDDNPFRGLTVYTATVTVTAHEGYTFTGLTAATINGGSANISGSDGTTVTLSHTFAATLDKEITGITIISQPTELTYTEGESLNLSGLVVTLTFDSGPPEDIALADFGAYNISAVPAHGTPLTMAHNGQPIVVSAGGHSANTGNLTVRAGTTSVTGVTLNTDSLILAPGDIATLIATVAPGNAANKAVTWSTSNESVVSVHNGEITAIAEGNAIITVTTEDGGLTATCGVTVQIIAVPVTGVTLDPPALTLTVGETKTLTATVSPSDATIKTVKWSSDEKGVATVSNGTVTAHAAGTAKITVTTDEGGLMATCEITVIKAAGAEVTKPTVYGLPTSSSITVNAVSLLTATGQSIEYAILTENNGNPSTWQSDTTFTGLISGTTYFVYARSASDSYHYEAGPLSVSDGITTASNKDAIIPSTGAEYNTLAEALDTAANGSASAPTEIVILRDITATSGYTIPKDKHIKLTVELNKSRTITASAGNFPLFTVSNAGSSLTLEGKGDDGILTLNGNKETAASSRRGVYVSDGTLVMNDGVTIIGFNNTNIGYGGGGVYAVSGATFTMYGGKISGNNTTSIASAGLGGGVYVGSSATFTMYDGDITDNTSLNGQGGGVYVAGGTFIMEGGKIIKNTTSYLGGGVYVASGGIFTMNNGDITGNISQTGGGGGVYISCASNGSSASFTMSGGEISGNSATKGGGVYITQANGGTATFTMSGGTIYGTDNSELTNKATGSNPQGVALYNDGGTAKYGGSYGSAAITTTDNTLPSEPIFTSIDDFAIWLAAQSNNTPPAVPYSVKLNVNDLYNADDDGESLKDVLYVNNKKYVNLDLSGSTFNIIYDDAFEGCSNLTNVTIPNSVTSIGGYAFYGCENLKNVTIPNSVTSIGKNAFNECTALTGVIIPNSVKTIGDFAFSQCENLKNVTIGNSVTSIGTAAFSACTGLTSITIPNSVTSIGNNAFESCSNLTGITIPNSVTSIGNFVFYGCENLKNVTIPNSVTSIGKYAFDECTALTSITIPNNVTSIGNNAFSYCTSLTNVTLPNNASFTSIEAHTFYGCENLKNVTIPNSVKNIGASAFGYCGSFTSVTIPDSVTSIGDYAFVLCRDLTSVTLGSGVTSIGNLAFFGLAELTRVTFNSVISTTNFSTNNFPHLLRETYLAADGGIGMYTRADSSSTTWEKQ